MGTTSDPERGGVDWLDLGPDPDEGKPPRDPRHRYLWYGGAAALVVAVLLTRTQHGANRAATSPRSPSAGVPSSSAAVSSPATEPVVAARTRGTCGRIRRTATGWRCSPWTAAPPATGSTFRTWVR